MFFLRNLLSLLTKDAFAEDSERGSIPEWVMLLVMGVGIVMFLWALVQPDLGDLVTGALQRLRG